MSSVKDQKTASKSSKKGSGESAKFTKMVKHVKQPKLHVPHADALKYVLKSIAARQEALALAVKARKASGWFSSSGSAAGSDSKSAGPEEDLLSVELKAGRSALASAYGKRPVPFVIPISLSIPNTAAGLALVSVLVDPSASVEWSSLALLFDEYRFVGGRFEFGTNFGCLQPATNSDAICFAICYDPVDSSPTSVRNLTTREQHKLFANVITYGGAGGSTFSTSSPNMMNGVPLQFKYHAPPASNLVIGVTGLIVQDPGVWKITTVSGAPAGEGYLLFASSNGSANAAVVAAGIHYLHVEMRCRGS